jgi:ribonuclease HII
MEINFILIIIFPSMYYKGDSKVLSIAAASILAKNYRDRLMIELHEEFPEYGWNTNFGYATKSIRKHL